MLNTKLKGRMGEAKAADYLRAHGYKIVGMNYSARFGELDIIAEYGKLIVFVEVKLRKNADFAPAREFVTAAKIEKIKMTAELWLAENNVDKPVRFDVIELYPGPDERIHHLEDAFR